MDKDRSIIIQVAAKIAADLTNTQQTSQDKVSEFAIIFSDIKDILIEGIYGQSSNVANALIAHSEEQQVEMIREAFPNAQEVHNISVIGKQHGDLPDWLITACKRDGITKVYDNRDGLAANPKRPWFKAVDDKEKAYWPPRGK